MSLDYKGWSGRNRISSDHEDTVERALAKWLVKVQSPSASDLHGPLNGWLLMPQQTTKRLAQAFGNVIAFLDLTAESKEKRSNLAQAKREFAEANGIPVSQVRINRNN
jgi:hypothetical protein